MRIERTKQEARHDSPGIACADGPYRTTAGDHLHGTPTRHRRDAGVRTAAVGAWPADLPPPPGSGTFPGATPLVATLVEAIRSRADRGEGRGPRNEPVSSCPS